MLDELVKKKINKLEITKIIRNTRPFIWWTHNLKDVTKGLDLRVPHIKKLQLSLASTYITSQRETNYGYPWHVLRN